MLEINAKINSAYDKRIEAHQAMVKAEMELTRAQRALKADEYALTREGIEGKNAAERAANLTALTASRVLEVAQCEDVLTVAKMEYEIARLETSRLRLLVDAAGSFQSSALTVGIIDEAE